MLEAWKPLMLCWIACSGALARVVTMQASGTHVAPTPPPPATDASMPGPDGDSGPAARHKRSKPDADGPAPYPVHSSNNEGSLRELVQVQGALLLQLSAEHRQVAKEEQFIIAIPPEATQYRELLQATHKRWHDNRPEVGQHPMGPLHVALWNIFWHYSRDVLSKSRVGGTTDKLISAMAEDAGTKITRFNPLGKRGRPPPQTGPWLWALRFHMLTHKGRELAELLLHSMRNFDLDDVTIRMDRGTMGTLERQLRDMQLGAPPPGKGRGKRGRGTSHGRGSGSGALGDGASGAAR